MKRVVILAVLCFVSLCVAQNPYIQTQSEIDMWVNSHNAVRKAYGITAMFTWDAQLAADCLAYAQQCKVNPLTHSTSNGAYGENLSTYMATPKPAVWPYKTMDYHVVSGWYSEEPYYNCGANTCDTTGGKMCGHLTQIVWTASTKLGCAIAYCPSVISGKTWHVQNAVCRYTTPGNYIGQHPLGTNGATKCPKTPTVLGPFAPAPVGPVTPPLAPVTPVKPPTAPVAPPTAPVAAPSTPVKPAGPSTPVKPAGPSTPVKPAGPSTPVKPAGPTAPVKPPTTPVAPPTAPVTAPVAVPTSGPWWKDCIADYWPTDSAGKQYQKLTPCCWEPWKDTSGGKTWCCPNCADVNDYSWPAQNLGTPQCPDGKAPSYAKAEENADSDSGLPMGAWIGIAVGIAVVIIIIIVVIIIVQKKKNDERV